MHSEISSATYDAILGYIVEHVPLGEQAFFGSSVDSKPFAVPENVTMKAFKAILSFFEQKGFITNLEAVGYDFSNYSATFIFLVPGLQFYNLGGFALQEDLLVKTFEKLQLELESLKETAPDRAARITGIMGNIGSIIQAITGVAGMLK